jgi:hypothetical protein
MLVEDEEAHELRVLEAAQTRFPELRAVIDENHEQVGAFRLRARQLKNAKQLLAEERWRHRRVVEALELLMSDAPPKNAHRKAFEAIATFGQWCNNAAR